MRYDLFAEFSFGKIALKKIEPESPDFRLYMFGFTGRGNQHEEMKVSGAVFREPLRGPNKGTLSIMVPKTSRTVYVTATEIAAFENASEASVRPGHARASTTHSLELLQRALQLEQQ